MVVATVVAVVVVVARIVAMHPCFAWDPEQLVFQLALGLATAPLSSLVTRKNPWQQLDNIF